MTGSKDYEVGYGRPPKAHQFRPGQSGNRRGRPTGSRPVGAILKDIMYEKVTVVEGGHRRRIPRLVVMLRQLTADAARGDARAIKLTLELHDRYRDPAESSVGRSEGLAAEDVAILAGYLAQTRGDRGDQGDQQAGPSAGADESHEIDGDEDGECP